MSCRPVDVRAEVARVVEEILRPLLEADGGGIEIVSCEGDEVVVELTGALRGDPGASYVRARIVEPAIHAAVGRPIPVRYAHGTAERASRP